MGNKYQDNLIKSMQMMANAVAKKTQGTGTYQGQIVEIIDDESYKVDFRGNKITCYTSNINLKYTVGEMVTFIVPKNDFNEHKTIIGSANPGSTTYDQEKDMQGWANISGNLLRYGKNVYRLSTWNTLANRTKCWKVDSENPDAFNYADNLIILGDTDLKLLNQYLKNGYTNFKFGIKLFTQMSGNNQAYGNYGIKFIFEYKINNNGYSENYSPREIIIDNDNILGNPYRQEDPAYTDQEVIFKIDQNTEITKAYIQFFSYDFPDQNENPTADKFDIWIKGIKLNALDSISNLNGIHLNIISDRGFYLTSEYPNISDAQGKDNNTDDILTTTLEPMLIVNGEEVDLDSDAVEDIVWFEEDDRIDTNSDGYREYGGIQWKCINDKEDNKNENTGEHIYTDRVKQKSIIAVSATPNDALLPAHHTEIYLSRQIKCVLKYKGAWINAIVTIVNLDTINSLEINLFTKNGQTIYSPTLGYVNMICTLSGEFSKDRASLAQYYYYWSLYDRNMKKIGEQFYTLERLNEWDKDNNIIYSEIKFPTHLIDDFCFIKVSAYFPIDGEHNGILIGSKMTALSTSDDLSYILGIDNSEPLYKYDKDGDSPLTEDMYDGPASSKITDTKPMLIRIYNKDGSEIDSDNYEYATFEWRIPKNSLIVCDGTTYENKEQNGVIISGQEQYNSAYTTLINRIITKEYPEEQKKKDIEDFINKNWYSNNDEYFICTGRELKYTIAKKYRRDKNDNSIIVKVTYDGIVLNQLVTVQFLKDYFDGIEGSKYSLFLQLDENSQDSIGENYAYEEKDEDGLHKLRLYNITRQGYNNNDPAWYWATKNYNNGNLFDTSITNHRWNSAKFNIQLYRDGEEATIDPKNVEWKMFGDDKDLGLNIEGHGTYAILTGTPKVDQINIIQVSYKVSTGGEDNKKTYKLYAYYPIECIVINGVINTVSIQEIGVKNKLDFCIAPTIDYGFNTVIYTSEGVNPQYDYAEDYRLNYGDIVDSYFSDIDNTSLRANFEEHLKQGFDTNKKYWNGNTDNFDDKQKVLKPAQKYNRNNLSNKVKLENWVVPSQSNIKAKITELVEERDGKMVNDVWQKGKYTPLYTWDAAESKWNDINRYLTTNFQTYLHNCLINRNNKATIQNLTNSFLNGLIDKDVGLINDNSLANFDSTDPLQTYKNDLLNIQSKHDNKNYDYEYLNIYILNPLRELINIYSIFKDDNTYEPSEVLKRKYEDEENKYKEIRERYHQEIEAYKNLLMIGGKSISFYQPVAFLYDVEMLAEIENYDGTQKIGTESQELNIINQGAGVIDGDGFSGIALGSQKEQGKLIGYCHNKQTFTLDRHGNLTLLGQLGSNCGYCLGNDQSGGNLEVAGKTTIHGDETIDGRFALFSAGFAAVNLAGWEYNNENEEEEDESDDGWNDERYKQQYSNYYLYENSASDNDYVINTNKTVNDYIQELGDLSYQFDDSGRYLTLGGFFIAQGNYTQVQKTNCVESPGRSSGGKSKKGPKTNRTYGDGGSLFAIMDEKAQNYGYDTSICGLSSVTDDNYGVWAGWQGPGKTNFAAQNNFDAKAARNTQSAVYAKNFSAGGTYGGPKINIDDNGNLDSFGWIRISQGSAGQEANGNHIIISDCNGPNASLNAFQYSYGTGKMTYIDKNGNFVSPNLICGTTIGSGSTPGLGLGCIKATGGYNGQLIVAGGSITDCGKITCTGDWRAMTASNISNTQLTNPRLQVSKSGIANQPNLVRGWIKINDQYIFINEYIILPATTKTVKTWNYTSSSNGCTVTGTNATGYVTYSVSPGSLNFNGTGSVAVITFTNHLTNGTGSVSCSCSGCGCGTKSGSITYYTWNSPKASFKYNSSTKTFDWDVSDYEATTAVTSHPVSNSCSCPSCPENGGSSGETSWAAGEGEGGNSNGPGTGDVTGDNGHTSGGSIGPSCSGPGC